MRIHLLGLLIFFYLFCRVVLPLPVGKGLKTTAGGLLLLLTQQHFLYRHVFGGMASPELPFPLLLLSTGAFIFLVFLTLLTLGGDIASALGFLSARRRCGGAGGAGGGGGFSPGRRRAIMACLAAAPSLYGVRNALAVPEVHCLEARLQGMPKALDGLLVVQISDLHVSALLHGARVRSVVERINALKPDIVVLTGDIVDGFPDRRAEGVAPLRNLRAACGVFACAGNHEYYADFNAWMRVFRELGVTMLLNSHKALELEGETLVLAGLTDMVAERYGLPLPNARAALTGAPKGAFIVMLDHRPVNAEANAVAGARLQLSGHTHGGQILGMSELVAAYNNGYLSGWYQVSGMRMYVSPGAGLWNGFPVRLGVPSEIAALTLRAA